MLISPDSTEERIRFLAPRVVVVDEQGNEVQTVYSFDTVTKEAEVFLLNEKGEVRVLDGKPVTEKKLQPGWRVFDKFTKEEVV